MQHQAIETPAAEPVALGFTIARDDLHGALSLLTRVVERRNTIPVLSTLLFEPAAEGSAVEITATDLDLQLTLTLACAWAGAGRFCIAARDLADVIKKAPKGGDVDFAAAGDKMTVRSGRNLYRLGMVERHAEDFPFIAVEREGSPIVAGFTLPVSQFAADLAAVAWAQGKEEVRYYLVGTAMQRMGESLYLAATNGCSLAYVERSAPEGSEHLPNVILPAKASDILRRALKGVEGDVSLRCSDSRFSIEREGLRLAGKFIDGTFPDWRRVLPAEGDPLQLVAMPETEPRMPLSAVEMAAKALGAAPAVEMADNRVRLTSAARPEFTAVCMLLKEAALPKGFEYEMPGHAAALDYLTDLATGAGLRLFYSEYTDSEGITREREERALNCEAGLVIGATFGRQTQYAGKRECWVERPNYETFTMETVKVIEVAGDEWEDGAYSVAMPRLKAGMAAAVTIGEPGVDERAVATKGGAVMLSAEQIAALAGDPAEFERVDIPECIYWHGRPLEQGWQLPERLHTIAAAKPGARNRRRPMTDYEVMRAYTDDPAAVVASLQPRPTVEATVIAETVAGLAMVLSGWHGCEEEGAKVIPFIRPAPAVEMVEDPEEVEAEPAPAVENAPAAETPVERDSEVAALPPQPQGPENAPGEALAGPETVPEVPADPLSARIAALEARLAALESANGSRTQPECETGAAPPADDPLVEKCDTIFVSRERRLRIVRRYLAMRAQRDLDKRALMEGRGWLQDRLAELEEMTARAAIAEPMVRTGRKRSRALVKALRAARASTGDAKMAARVEDAEFRAADLAKQVEDLSAKLATETARADSADIRWDEERDRLQARIVDLENRLLSKLSGGKVTLPPLIRANAVPAASPWPVQNASNGRLQ